MVADLVDFFIMIVCSYGHLRRRATRKTDQTKPIHEYTVYSIYLCNKDNMFDQLKQYNYCTCKA